MEYWDSGVVNMTINVFPSEVKPWLVVGGDNSTKYASGLAGVVGLAEVPASLFTHVY